MGEPTEEPTEPTEEPTEPTEPTEEPTEPTEEPTEPTEPPTEPTEEPPVPGPCNVINCSGLQCTHCTGECIMDENSDEQCVCEPGWHGNKCKEEDFMMA